MSPSLRIKGISDGVLIGVPEGEWEEVYPALLEAIDDRPDFFRGARVILELGARDLGASELGRLRDMLAAREIDLAATLSSSEHTRAASADLGLALEIPLRSAAHDEPLDPIVNEVEGEEAVLLRRTLRSGQTVRHRGHVILIGDVNPGAEVIAGGNIVVWGRVRGVVHAGAAGDEGAWVCALDLAPTQCRIAGLISISPERRGKPKPEVIRVRDGQLVAETWDLERSH